jgi:hypothetical protein
VQRRTRMTAVIVERRQPPTGERPERALKLCAQTCLKFWVRVQGGALQNLRERAWPRKYSTVQPSPTSNS